MELKVVSKVLIVFTVGPLGFYKCEQMPLGLMKTLVTFQYLMETCLGNLQFQWCIMYLNDIIVFAANPKKHLERL